MRLLRVLGYIFFMGFLFLPVGDRSIPHVLAADTKSKPGMFVADVPGGPSKFFLDLGNAKVHFAQDAIWFTAIQRETPAKTTDPLARTKVSHKSRNGVNIKLTFPGANTSPIIEPLNKLASKVSYLKGNDRSKWRPNLETYDGVRYNDLYPGIDLEVRLVNGKLEPQFILRGGANLALIQTKWEGATGVGLNSDASAAKLQTAIGDIFVPLFKVSDSKGSAVRTQKPTVQGLQISNPFTSAQNTGQSSPLVDVNIIYIPGVDCNTSACEITQSKTGETYVTGITDGTTFQPTSGAFDTTFNGGTFDGFVVKIDSLGNIVFATYLGGSNDESTANVFLDNNNNIYVAGTTYSNDFPVTTGAFDTTCGTDGNCNANGGTILADGYAVELSSNGSTLIYGTYIGGEGEDYLTAMAIDDNSNVFLTGQTSSLYFPTTTGAYQKVYGGGSDVFVVNLNSSGSALNYGTYIGNSTTQTGSGIVVDKFDNAYISGLTQSGYPTTSGAYQTVYGGGSYDGFLTKLDSSGSSLLFSTYIGGNDNDGMGQLKLDVSKNPILTGYTYSLNYPTTSGAYLTNSNGNLDIVLTKINSTGTKLLYSTYIGGKDSGEFAYDLDLDQNGNVYVTGYTGSPDFPTTAGSAQTIFGGGSTDAFLSEINMAGKGTNDLIYSTFLGNPSDDTSWSDKVISASSVNVAGGSTPIGVSGALFDDPAKPTPQGYVASFTLPSTVAQDIDSSITYDTWAGTSDTNASGGTYRSSSASRAKASLTFSGTDVTWVTKTGPDQGKALVLIDGATKGTFNLKSTTTEWNVQKSFTGLPSGNHTITVAVSGGGSVSVDSFIVGGVRTEDTSPSIQYDNWIGTMQARADGGSYRSAKTTNASASWTFTGSQVRWVTATGPASGQAQVSIDGAVVATEDLYLAKQTWKVVKSYTPSVSGSHTITITALGTKNPASTGTNVTVDGFQAFQ